MSDRTPEHHRLPSTTNWRARVVYALRALGRDATRYRDLTLTEAPVDLNTPHLDFLLRPSLVGGVKDVIDALGRGLYNIEVHARFRGHRPEDGADLTQARQHLTEAARHLSNICTRAKGDR